VDIDGVRVEHFTQILGGPPNPWTINGGSSFDSEMASEYGHDHLEVFYGALGLEVGPLTPTGARFRLELRRYDRSTNPYTLTSLVGQYASPGVPPTFSGTVNTVAIGEHPGDDVCGTFDVTAVGSDAISAATHTIHLTGTFHQVVPSTAPGKP
jgi:hypothetical protein